MAQGKYDRKLRHRWVGSDVQIRMILNNLIYMLLIITVTFAILLSPIIHDMFVSHDLELQYEAAQTFLSLLKRLVPAVAVMFLFIFMHQISFTHRVLGPLVNFRNTFQKIMEGDLERTVVLRKGDYLEEECRMINDMIDTLSHNLVRTKMDVERFLSKIDEIARNMEGEGKSVKVNECLDMARKEAMVVKNDLSFFKTADL